MKILTSLYFIFLLSLFIKNIITKDISQFSFYLGILILEIINIILNY